MPTSHGADNAVVSLAVDLDQHDKARAAFDLRRDVAVSGIAPQITFLSTGRRMRSNRREVAPHVCPAVVEGLPRRMIRRLRRRAKISFLRTPRA